MKYRCEQGSNLRGKIPLDFKSNALTTRPSQHFKFTLLQNNLVIVNAPVEFTKSQQNTVCGGLIMIPIKRQRPNGPDHMIFFM